MKAGGWLWRYQRLCPKLALNRRVSVLPGPGQGGRSEAQARGVVVDVREYEGCQDPEKQPGSLPRRAWSVLRQACCVGRRVFLHDV